MECGGWPDGGEAVQDLFGGDDDQGEDGDRGTEGGQAGGADEQADGRRQARSPGGGRADLPGDDVVRPLLAEADRGQRDQGREDPGQRAAEHDEADHCHRDVGPPPDRRGGEHRDAAAPADHGLRRDRAGQQGQADPDGGEGSPVAERGQAGRPRLQVQLAAAEARLPLPGADFQAGVDEEDAHVRDHHRAVLALRPRGGRVRRPAAGSPPGPRLAPVTQALASPLPHPQHAHGQVKADLRQVGGPPQPGQDGGGDEQPPYRGAHAVGVVQEVEQPLAAGQGDRGVEPRKPLDNQGYIASL